MCVLILLHLGLNFIFQFWGVHGSAQYLFLTLHFGINPDGAQDTKGDARYHTWVSARHGKHPLNYLSGPHA